MDSIILDGIELYAYGGVTEAERQIGQRYRVRVVIGADLSAAGVSDDLEDTIHYGEVYRCVADALREHPFRLLEAAAERAASRILSRFPARTVNVRLEKLLPPIDGVVASAAVEITRSAAGEPQEDEARGDK